MALDTGGARSSLTQAVNYYLSVETLGVLGVSSIDSSSSVPVNISGAEIEVY